MALTYATWNPSDKGPNLTLSGGNLTVTKSTAGAELVRSTISKGASSGKWYWEETITGNNHIPGVANSSATTGGFVGFDANGWGFYTNGKKYTNSVLSAYGTSFTTGDVIGVAFDYSGATASITFYKNNVSQGVAFSGLSGTLFAAVGLASTSSTVTNFGATTFIYTPPTGFVGLSTGTAENSNFFMFF